MAGSRHRRVARAVAHAEAHTGLQFCIYLGRADTTDATTLAAELFATHRPAVLVVVVPTTRRVEILTAEGVRDRITDEACEAAIERMRPHLRRRRFDHALATAVQHLAEAAGPGDAELPGDELPDVIDERD